MKTFEEDYKELLKWFFSEQDKIEGKKIPWEGGLDGEHTSAIRALTNEYRLKLRMLQRKYDQ